MKAQFKILGAVIAATISSAAFAGNTLEKPAVHIDFNKMIDDSHNDQKDLQQTVQAEEVQAPAAATATKSDKSKVLDFVDVEVGVGQDRPVVVDRRYNSVGEAIPVDASKLQALSTSEEKPGT